MKELILSDVEKEFILKAVGERKRLDGREAFAYRQIRIRFGTDRGCCFVEFGNTKVMAQVSCEVVVPKDSRPNEGTLTVNVELSPMAAPHFEAGRPSDETIEINRLLERCLRESRCLDTESLCIVAGLKVWSVRVDVHVLDYDGNIIDAASVAALSALVHFRRPDVTICGNDVTIHSLEEREPIALSVHHMPLCTSFAFFDTGKFVVVDPTQREQMVADGTMVVAMNKHREICLLQMSGSMLLLSEQVLRCTNIASVKVAAVTELIQSALQNDAEARLKGKTTDFTISVSDDSLTSVVKSESAPVDLNGVNSAAMKVVEDDDDDEIESSSVGSASSPQPHVTVIDSGIASIGEGGANSWEQIATDMTEDLKLIETMQTDQVSTPSVNSRKTAASATTVNDSVHSDSEEESVMVVGAGDVKRNVADVPAVAPQSHAASGLIDLTVALKKKNDQKPAKLKQRKQKPT